MAVDGRGRPMCWHCEAPMRRARHCDYVERGRIQYIFECKVCGSWHAVAGAYIGAESDTIAA